MRPVQRSDLEGLAALYAGLDPEDRHRRFFSAFRPSSQFLEALTTVADRGGFGLVATVAGSDDDGVDGGGAAGEIVGEASYVLLPNGDGELGITVAEAWRGWLGPYLLDALIEAAAARGVPNLEADVLVTNGPMLALAHARGCVTMSHPDWSAVRVRMSTRGTSSSSGAPGPPPLAEEECKAGESDSDAPRRAALEVAACIAPTRPGRPCPRLAGEPCPLGGGAGVGAMEVPPATTHTGALEVSHQLDPGVGICVEAIGGDTTAVSVAPRQRGTPRPSQRSHA